MSKAIKKTSPKVIPQKVNPNLLNRNLAIFKNLTKGNRWICINCLIIKKLVYIQKLIQSKLLNLVASMFTNHYQKNSNSKKIQRTCLMIKHRQ